MDTHLFIPTTACSKAFRSPTSSTFVRMMTVFFHFRGELPCSSEQTQMPSPSSLSPLPVSLGLSSRFVGAVPPRSCAPLLPRLPTCGLRQAHHRHPACASRPPDRPVTMCFQNPTAFFRFTPKISDFCPKRSVTFAPKVGYKSQILQLNRSTTLQLSTAIPSPDSPDHHG